MEVMWWRNDVVMRTRVREQAPKRRTDINISPPAKDSSSSKVIAPPVPGSVLVKVHVGKDSGGFKLNDIVEFVGVLCGSGERRVFRVRRGGRFRSSPLHLPCVHSVVFRQRMSIMSLPNTHLTFTSLLVGSIYHVSFEQTSSRRVRGVCSHFI